MKTEKNNKKTIENIISIMLLVLVIGLFVLCFSHTYIINKITANAEESTIEENYSDKLICNNPSNETYYNHINSQTFEITNVLQNTNNLKIGQGYKLIINYKNENKNIDINIESLGICTPNLENETYYYVGDNNLTYVTGNLMNPEITYKIFNEQIYENEIIVKIYYDLGNEILTSKIHTDGITLEGNFTFKELYEVKNYTSYPIENKKYIIKKSLLDNNNILMLGKQDYSYSITTSIYNEYDLFGSSYNYFFEINDETKTSPLYKIETSLGDFYGRLITYSPDNQTWANQILVATTINGPYVLISGDVDNDINSGSGTRIISLDNSLTEACIYNIHELEELIQEDDNNQKQQIITTVTENFTGLITNTANASIDAIKKFFIQEGKISTNGIVTLSLIGVGIAIGVIALIVNKTRI